MSAVSRLRDRVDACCVPSCILSHLERSSLLPLSYPTCVSFVWYFTRFGPSPIPGTIWHCKNYRGTTRAGTERNRSARSARPRAHLTSLFLFSSVLYHPLLLNNKTYFKVRNKTTYASQSHSFLPSPLLHFTFLFSYTSLALSDKHASCPT
jgi:hypothetical protein